ncbi:hypothetical protein JYB64_07690 [Algoriphagus aestuarii]|nr:hypothetical protein [Algoriphagus aestuarii]
MIHSESVNLMVSFFLLVGLAIPFAYTKFNFQNLPKNTDFQDFISQNNFKLTKVEKWKNHQLGIDAEKNKLVYFRNGNYPVQTIIDLKEVKNISIDEHCHSTGSGRLKHEIIDYLGVKVQFTDANHPAKMLEIYDQKLFPSMTAEKAIAKKWIGILQERINK